MSSLYIAMMKEVSKEDKAELNKLYNRIPTSTKGSAFDEKNIILPKGLGANYGQRVRKDFETSCENGLRHGRVSLPTYKKDFPVIVAPVYVRMQEENLESKNKSYGFYHEYKSYNELYDALKSGSPDIYWEFCIGMTFKVRVGNPYKAAFIRDELLHLFEGVYKPVGSQLSINKKGKIILSLGLEVPNKEAKLDENVTVGIDIGLAKPVVCAINNDFYKRKIIGDYDTFTKNRLRLEYQKRGIQKSLKYAKGGHGRNKKLRKLNDIRDRERRFVHTMNHKFSTEAVNFAIKNHAKYINIEDLSDFGKSKGGEVKEEHKFILRNWSYFELQQMIEYKASAYGIKVRKINPQYTSQTCSCCGKKGKRIDQATFFCEDPNCISHRKYENPRKNGQGNYTFNADFNAARNISMSEDFVKNKKKTKAEKQAERKKKSA